MIAKVRLTSGVKRGQGSRNPNPARAQENISHRN
jgi:hypothetical protein